VRALAGTDPGILAGLQGEVVRDGNISME